MPLHRKEDMIKAPFDRQRSICRKSFEKHKHRSIHAVAATSQIPTTASLPNKLAPPLHLFYLYLHTLLLPPWTKLFFKSSKPLVSKLQTTPMTGIANTLTFVNCKWLTRVTGLQKHVLTINDRYLERFPICCSFIPISHESFFAKKIFLNNSMGPKYALVKEYLLQRSNHYNFRYNPHNISDS